MKGIISIDWLGINVKNKHSIFNFSPKYRFENLGISTRHFTQVENVFLGKELICSITHTPHKNSVIPLETIQVKFDNSFLYELNLKQRVELFLSENNLVFTSLSRFDICYDFNKFSNGWTGEKFVNNYSKEIIERKAHGHYTISGRKSKDGRKENYLAFGSRTSDTRMYMYDKTLELSEKKSKPYIKKLWLKNGLDTESVWRVEFSMTNFNKGFANKDTGETLFCMNNLDCLLQKNVHRIFKFLYFKYMFFYKTAAAKSNVSRNNRIKLIAEFETGERLDWFELREKESSSRTEKIILKRINEHFNEVRKLKNPLPEIEAYKFFIKSYLDNHVNVFDLQMWAQRKLPDYNEHDTADPASAEKIYKFIHNKIKDNGTD
jgi:hypothetical protein